MLAVQITRRELKLFWTDLAAKQIGMWNEIITDADAGKFRCFICLLGKSLADTYPHLTDTSVIKKKNVV